MKKIIYLLVCFLLISAVPNMVYAKDELSALEVKASVLMEAQTGEILYESNPDEQLPIASITKIMTLLLTMERIESGELALTDVVTASENASSYGGSTMFLETGEQVDINEMLKGITVASANDGCVAMAEHIAGTESAFVEMMNRRAQELGMNNTHFMNSNGLDEDGHYSSARDVAIMSRELIKHEKILDYTTIWMDTMRGGKYELANTNKLIRYYKGATGLKTGSTSKAGCCLSATAQRDGMELIAVVLGAEDTQRRFSSATALLNYGFDSYKMVKQTQAGEVVGKTRVAMGKTKEVTAVAAEDYSILQPKSESVSVEKSVSFSDVVTAPVKKGDKLGEIKFTDGKEVVKIIDIIASEDVAKKGIFAIFGDILRGFVTGTI